MTRLALLASALALAAALPASADTRAIRFQNSSGATVYRLYSSPTHNASWEQDLLGASVLPPGQGLDVVIHNVSNCRYDVLIEWETGYRETDTWDICAYDHYEIR